MTSTAHNHGDTSIFPMPTEKGDRMKVYVNNDSTVLVTTYPDGSITVATRADSDDLWGPPIRVEQSNG